MPRKTLNYTLEQDKPWPPPNDAPEWWHDDHAHGASGVGTRATRRPPPKKTRWPLVAALVGLVLLLGLFVVSYMDIQRGRMLGSDPTPALSPPRPNLMDKDLTSVDTVAGDLEDHGFTVDPLIDYTDQQLLAYEAVETKVNGVPVYILSFKDRDTTHEWAETSDAFDGIAVVGDNWGISLESDGNDARAKDLAQKISKAIGGDAQYRGE